MIKVRKGTQIMTIPKGAFKTFYKGAGWVEFEEVKTPRTEKVSVQDAPETVSEAITPDTALSDTSEEVKDIKSMTNAELKAYARSKGIKTSGVSKKALIETLLESE